MVGQTPEGLGADNVPDPGFRKLKHLGGKQPALAHFRPGIDVPVGKRDHVPEVGHPAEPSVRCDNVGKIALFRRQERKCRPAYKILQLPEPVKPVVMYRIVHAVQKKVHKPRNDRLRALRYQKFFKIVVPERGVFNEDLADDADLHSLARDDFYFRKAVEYQPVVLLHPPVSGLPGAELFSQPLRPYRGKPLGFTGYCLIGTHLIDDAHKQIAVKHAVNKSREHRQAEPEARGLFDPGKAEGDDRNVLISRLLQRLSQQRYIVRRAAPATGLKVDESHPVRIVFPRFKRGYELPDDKKSRVAGVVVNVAQAVFDYFGRASVKKHRVVAVAPHDADHHRKMHRQHCRRKYRVVFLHFPREGYVGFRFLFLHSELFPIFPSFDFPALAADTVKYRL